MFEFSQRENMSVYSVLLYLAIYPLLLLSPSEENDSLIYFFFPALVTVIYISSPFYCISPWIRQACSNLRFTLKVTESPLTWQRLCMTRTVALGGDPLVWAGAFNKGDASKFNMQPKPYWEKFLYFFSPFSPSGHPELGQVNLPAQCSRWFPMGWSLKDSGEQS